MTQVKQVMTGNVDLVEPDASLEEAARRMQQDDIGALPVARGDRLVGMLTDRDIVIRAVARGLDVRTAKVREAMSDKILYCFDDEAVDEVLKNMGNQQVRRLPVVNRKKRLVGMVSIGDLSAQAPAERVGKALHAISS